MKAMIGSIKEEKVACKNIYFGIAEDIKVFLKMYQLL